MDFVLLNGSKSAELKKESLNSLNNDLSKELFVEEKEDKAPNTTTFADPSNVRPRRRHRLFRTYHQEEEDIFLPGSNSSEAGSTASFLAHMNTPSPSDIREWMEDTQDTVGKVVTNWQQDLIESSSKITEILTQLIQFVKELENNSSSSPVYILSAKLTNNQGTFESVINVYLQLILISLRKVAAHSTTTMEGSHEDPETEHRKKKNKRRRFDRQHNKLLVDILGQFAVVAEDALNFLQAHNKILGPACERILEMRNSLYYFLRQVVAEPSGQIIPLVSNVRLEKIRQREDFFWLQRLCHENKARERCIPNYLEIRVGSKDCKFVNLKEGAEGGGDEKMEKGQKSGITETELSVDERLELMKLLLKQLGTSLGSSCNACRSGQSQFSDLQGRLMGKFQKLVRNLQVEKKHDKLKAENCCEHLKASLCELEVKFHQVERIYEEIPQHLKRVIGVADYCSKQLMQDFGLEEELELEESSSWTSPIEEISVEFFKGGRKGFVTGCFPYIWRIIVKVFAGNLGGGGAKRLKQFWEEVRSEMEDLQKEIKMKELEEEYGVVLRVPLSFLEGKDEKEGKVVISVLNKYA